MDEDALPAARLSLFSPIFPVRDLRRALAHYASLGFEVRPYRDGDFYGFADRDGVGLHLSADHHEHEHDGEHNHDGGHGHDDHEREHAGSAYLYADDADALYAEWARPGVGGLTRRVRDTPYELREGSHTDPDGNLIRFGSPLPGQPGQLRAHLEAQYAISVETMTELDVGVWRVGRAGGADWVARWFPASRPASAAAGDAEILRFLAQRDYPAERPAADVPVSVLRGRPVLVTRWAPPVPRDRRREAIRAAGGLAQLGELLGQLHSFPPGPGALARPGGGWHHLADGGPAAEIAAAARLLVDAEHLFTGSELAACQALRAEVESLDDAAGLPEVLTHPDFVLANVVATADGMVLVDWAGAGRGPRVWALAFLLYAEAAKDLRRAAPVFAGYRRQVTLTGAELGRLAGIIPARPLTLAAWSVCTGRVLPSQAVAAVPELRTLAETIATRAQAASAR